MGGAPNRKPRSGERMQPRAQALGNDGPEGAKETHADVDPLPLLVFLFIVRMIWWFLIVAVAAGAAVWAVLSAYIRVRQRLSNAANRPPGPDQPEPGHDL